jgi:hypothetical protein
LAHNQMLSALHCLFERCLYARYKNEGVDTFEVDAYFRVKPFAIMWTRNHLECPTCKKVTCLRLHIPERNSKVIFKCLGCSTEFRGEILVDFKNHNWEYKSENGKVVAIDDVNSGDFFVEYSDTVPTRPPSTEPLNGVLPTIRLRDLDGSVANKNAKLLLPNEMWNAFKDLTRAYSQFNKPVIKTLSDKIVGDIYDPQTVLHDIDYQRLYFFALNYLVFPWVDFDDQAKFAKWITLRIFFDKQLTKHPELIDFSKHVMNSKTVEKLRRETADLIVRFADLRDFFFYAGTTPDKKDFYISNQGFTHIKSFYTDCFEFLGRSAHLISACRI